MSQTLANISITEEVGEKVDGNNATVSSATRGKQKSYELDCIYETVEEAEAVLKIHSVHSHLWLIMRYLKLMMKNRIHMKMVICFGFSLQQGDSLSSVATLKLFYRLMVHTNYFGKDSQYCY